MALRFTTNAWKAVAEEVIDKGFESGKVIVRGRKNILGDDMVVRDERMKLVTRVIFLSNITKVGNKACWYAINLVVVDIPEGVLSIGELAFADCTSLITVSFPTTLKSIGEFAFSKCEILDNVDLLHKNLQELGQSAFGGCGELKSMTIPDSLQKRGNYIFAACTKLVPSNIKPYVTDAVVAHLRSQQQLLLSPTTTTSGFITTPDFKRHLIPFISSPDTLFSLRLASKEWKQVFDARKSTGALLVHDGKSITTDEAIARAPIHNLTTQLIFLQNIPQIGDYACRSCILLVSVDIPEGVTTIGRAAFGGCNVLTSVSFPKSLKKIELAAFTKCISLQSVDLEHTNVNEISSFSFNSCYELKSFKFPESTTFGDSVFSRCTKLFPSGGIGLNSYNQISIIDFLRRKQIKKLN